MRFHSCLPSMIFSFSDVYTCDAESSSPNTDAATSFPTRAGHASHRDQVRLGRQPQASPLTPRAVRALTRHPPAQTIEHVSRTAENYKTHRPSPTPCATASYTAEERSKYRPGRARNTAQSARDAQQPDPGTKRWTTKRCKPPMSFSLSSSSCSSLLSRHGISGRACWRTGSVRTRSL